MQRKTSRWYVGFLLKLCYSVRWILGVLVTRYKFDSWVRNSGEGLTKQRGEPQ
jgi:hypothetical protein